MSTRRKMDALRALAERPGTEAEGKLAKEILERLQRSGVPVGTPDWERPYWRAFVDFDNGKLTKDEFIEALRKRAEWEREQPLPTHFPCACGNMMPLGVKCPLAANHANIGRWREQLFARGMVVYYNRWAYAPDSRGVVTGHYPAEWNWLRIKFDHLSAARNVPVYSHLGWHISTEPINSPHSPLRGV